MNENQKYDYTFFIRNSVLKKLDPIFTQKIRNFIWPNLKLSSYSYYLNYKKLDPILAQKLRIYLLGPILGRKLSHKKGDNKVWFFSYLLSFFSFSSISFRFKSDSNLHSHQYSSNSKGPLSVHSIRQCLSSAYLEQVYWRFYLTEYLKKINFNCSKHIFIGNH